MPIGWSFSCDPSVGSRLDLLQVELTSFFASGAIFFGREPERATKSLEFFVPSKLNQTKDVFESLG